MDIFATRVLGSYDYFEKANFEGVASSTARKKKKKSSSSSVNKRRFSDEQIRSLESIFYSSESKLDPTKKVQLATDLGLQPRQVAIWFQNRRARWKSKQIEKDFTSLRANYDNLASQFESLQEEKNFLLTQLQKLSELIKEKPQDQDNPCHDTGDNIGYESEAKARRLREELQQDGKKLMENGRHDQGLELKASLEDKSNNIRYIEEQECQLLDVNGSSESSENWCNFDMAGGVFEYQLQWPNFWG